MATSFSSVKTNIPGVGWRVYVFSQYRMQGGVCTPNPNNVSRQCMYLAGAGNQNDTWGPGQPFEGLFPNVGEFISADVGTYIQCYKVLEIIDEATFNTGTCVSCYNNGFQGNCSDAFVTTPPYPGDPNGCLYNNSINNAGILPASFPVGSQAFSYIQNDCRNCTTGSPPTRDPLNFVQNCCDPSEQYQFTSGSSIYTTLINLGVVAPNAFIADLYIGGAQTGMKCWSVGTNLSPQLIPLAYNIINTLNNTSVYTNCQDLQDFVQNTPSIPDCCGQPQTEWCCLTGVAGPPTICTQVALGTCSPAFSNYSAGPFQSQQLCLAAGCATVVYEPYECELPTAALINLQAKVKGFSNRRKQALNKPKADPAREGIGNNYMHKNSVDNNQCI